MLENVMSKILSLSFIFLLFACSNKVSLEGNWLFKVHVQGNVIPFIIDVKNEVATLHNGDQKFSLGKVLQSSKENKVFYKIPLHVFDAGLEFTLSGNEIKGKWIKYYKKEPYEVPITGKRTNNTNIFKYDLNKNINFPQRWDIVLNWKGEKTNAVGNFKTQGNKIYGTFLTTTGDYGHIQGIIDGKKIRMIGFDGIHAFYLKMLHNENNLTGEIFGGTTYKATLTGKVNPNAKLPDPYKLTYTKNDQKISFKLKDINGNEIEFQSPDYNGKVKVVQLFGSWCPNCLDETQFLTQWYSKNKNRGVEIFCLAFERNPNLKRAQAQLKKYAKKLNMTYPVMHADPNGNEKPLSFFPMLNHVMSFPTTLFIDKEGKIRKIHTGFSGPSTGFFYDQFKLDFNKTMDLLLKE